MLDKDTTIGDAQTIFCPDCGEDYRMVWSDNRNHVYVVCDCFEAEKINKFLHRFLAETADGVTAEPEDGFMYQ